MFQVRIHGRGGQGVVTAAELLSIAAFNEGRHAQAFPSFGSERMGAPVVSFCRMDDHEIRLREPVLEPDTVIIQDPSLLHSVNVFQGLSTEGYILVNSTRSYEDLGIADFVRRFPPGNVHSFGATELALDYIGRSVPNVALLGGFAAAWGRIGIDAVEAAIREKFTGVMGEANVGAARAAYDMVILQATERRQHA